MMVCGRWATGLLVLLSTMAGSQALGCWPLDFTESTGGTGAGGVGPPNCPGDPIADPSLVTDSCGTFVSATAAAGGNGTRLRPFNSFEAALTAGANRLYVCALQYDESIGITFNDGIEIFAGFTDCGSGGKWTWSEEARAILRGPADTVALTLDGGDSHIESLNVTAPNAVAAGASSIAVVLSGGTVNVNNSDFTAGNAKDGQAGISLLDDPTLDGDTGLKGTDACGPGATHPGAQATTKMCLSGDSSVGGKGGDGGPPDGMPAGNGNDGMPFNAMPPTMGLHGLGEGQLGAPAQCTAGTNGAIGQNGSSGGGAIGTGTISTTGYSGTNGVDGTPGQPGQGGGGGGGAKGSMTATCMGMPTVVAGSSGGAGGSGGCGGAGGTGGKAGGSSIALVVLDSAVSLSGVVLIAGRAGNGGNGGNGQNGGLPGQGGLSGATGGNAKASCSGGNGGLGGEGGPGGGGQGGHSLGIAFQGTTEVPMATFAVDPMNNGVGGLGGLNNNTPDNGKGADGVASNCWNFTTNMACGQ